jgi:hypothetical protein
MFLRIFSAVLLVALAACSSKTPASGQPEVSEAAAADSVPCAIAGAKTFTAQCAIERSAAEGKSLVVVHHPDGGFRRLFELQGGKSFAAADGADRVEIEANGAEVEVTVGDDHYLFPAPAAAKNAAKP